MQTQLARISRLAVLVAILGAAFSFVETKLLWGYWFRRPTVASSVHDVEQVLRVAAIPFDRDASTSERRQFLADARGRCTPVSNECLEGRLLLAIGPYSPASVDSCDDELQAAWLLDRKQRPLPIPNDVRYQPSAKRVAGIGVHFRERDGEYVALGYRTSEVSNDRYIYSEALYRVHGTSLDPVQRERFEYEVAGLEFADWLMFWFVNCVVLSLGAAVALAWQKAR